MFASYNPCLDHPFGDENVRATFAATHGKSCPNRFDPDRAGLHDEGAILVVSDLEPSLAAPEFHAALPNAGRLLGLDLGTKTIGTALCDAGWSFASHAPVIRRAKFADFTVRVS